MFVLDIFFQGDTAGRALSHFFNISKHAVSSQQPTQTASLSVITVSVTPTPSATSSTTAATSTPLAANDGGFGTGAKIGLAAGIVAVLVLGVVVGWFLSFLSRRNRGGRGQQLGPPMGGSGIEPQGHAAVVLENMDKRGPPRELPIDSQRYELSGTYHDR